MKAGLCDQHRPCAKEASEGVVNSLPRSFAANIGGLQVAQSRFQITVPKPRLYCPGAYSALMMPSGKCLSQRVQLPVVTDRVGVAA
jgi:hypothetical protein